MDIEIEKQVQYVNLELKKNPKATVNKICDKIGINKSTFKSRIHRAGYKFDFENRVYIKPNDDSPTNVIADIKTIEKKNDNSITNVIYDNDIQLKLLSLAENYDKILNLINNPYDKPYDGISIELPIEANTDFRTTIRVNDVVWEQFNEFANNHKEFTKKDLLSMALKDYINKYNRV